MADQENESIDHESGDPLAGFGAMSDVSEFRAAVEATREELDRELRDRTDKLERVFETRSDRD